MTLNDPVFLECAQALARRMLAEGGDTEAACAARGLMLSVGRSATPQEIERLVLLYRQALAALSADPTKALALATKPLGPLPEEANPVETAAWTVVANVLLNLDETLTKP